MKKYYVVLTICILFLFVIACAAGPNTAENTPGTTEHVAGFWKGLWHGIIAPVTFFISLFADNISLYEVHNNGGWYDFGFVLGAGILFGGGGRAAGRRR